MLNTTPVAYIPVARFHVVCLMSATLFACAGHTASSQANRGDILVLNTVLAAAVDIPTESATGGGEKSRFAGRARVYLAHHSAEYGILDAPSELAFKDETVDRLDHKHVRFQQVKSGVPVYGHELIVHFNPRDEAVSISGSFLAGLGQIDVRPRITADEAAATAVLLKGEGWGVAKPQLCIYQRERRSHLSYQFTLTRRLERWFVFVDAQDGKILHQVTGMYDAEP